MHGLDDSWGGREGDSAVGNDALEGDEGDCDHLAFFIARHLYMHEYRTKGVECVTTILPSKTNISPCAEWLDHDVRVKTKET